MSLLAECFFIKVNGLLLGVNGLLQRVHGK